MKLPGKYIPEMVNYVHLLLVLSKDKKAYGNFNLTENLETIFKELKT